MLARAYDNLTKRQKGGRCKKPRIALKKTAMARVKSECRGNPMLLKRVKPITVSFDTAQALGKSSNDSTNNSVRHLKRKTVLTRSGLRQIQAVLNATAL